MSVLLAYPWIADRFEAVKADRGGSYCTAKCPLKCHRHATVRFWVGKDGRLMFGCWAHCNKLEMLRAVGAKWGDCFPDGAVPEKSPREMTARYPYRDESGHVLYEVCRFEPGWNGRDKDLRPRFRDEASGVWVWGLPKEIRRVLYRLPELLAADPLECLFVVAGEKDANTLAGIGLTATTNVFGESSPWLDYYSLWLSGRHVAVIEDRDSAGKRHTDEVCGSLMKYALSLRRAVLPEKDATAFVNRLRMGGTAEAEGLSAELWIAVCRGSYWIRSEGE